MKTKVFKTYDGAKKASSGLPILRVGNLYIIGMKSLDEVTLIDSKGTHCGNVTMKHLNRLGNANWATSGDNRAAGHQIDWTGNI
jgi:hypothetical protein